MHLATVPDMRQGDPNNLTIECNARYEQKGPKSCLLHRRLAMHDTPRSL